MVAITRFVDAVIEDSSYDQGTELSFAYGLSDSFE